MRENAVPSGGNAAVAEAPERDLYPVSEAAVRLGIHVSTVWRLIADRDLRTVKLGGRRLVPASAIAEYIDRLEAAAADGTSPVGPAGPGPGQPDPGPSGPGRRAA